jgi:hypothetical protein
MWENSGYTHSEEAKIRWRALLFTALSSTREVAFKFASIAFDGLALQAPSVEREAKCIIIEFSGMS